MHVNSFEDKVATLTVHVFEHTSPDDQQLTSLSYKVDTSSIIYK